jgi:hypothetical protein
MVSDDIQQKSQEEYKGGLDEILMLRNSSAEAKTEYLREFVGNLSSAAARYIFRALTRAPSVSVDEKTGEIKMHLNGTSYLPRPLLRSGGDAFGGVVEIFYDFGGVASIKDNKLKLKLARGRVLEEIKNYGVSIISSQYESRRVSLYNLRKLSKMDEMLPIAIWLLGEELDRRGVGEEKRISIEYNMLTGDLKIELWGEDIIGGSKGRKNTYIEILSSLIHGYQNPTGRKRIELEGKKGQAEIQFNTKYIIEKDIIARNTYYVEKEKIPEVLNIISSEKTLNQKYSLYLEDRQKKNK